ncbi:glycoside hydrolase family 127 protein [Phototrophicus methaneseepsis]|uniref:Glycoside hydrolase family 127 protein n=1 Tax=Phototrophicus methaneseepsis TaxID=2710758 RepID=A0A7S8EE32_9CHLR|nr:beta-L-arabinofuranosidase domain-containing protein [Phototrophicus methaneseepsis]QPC85013.1 glycoside hydrolase family 127 protein [Phototrophicus methaneseepsis]
MKSHIKTLPASVYLDHIQLTDGFWNQKQTLIRNRTIPAIYHQLDKTGRLASWDLNPDRQEPKRHKVIEMFWDSDTGKWLEAVGYSLHTHPDAELEKLADELISRMVKAQQPDGYLNTYFTVLEKDMRWGNLRDFHELYNAGHLIEGAVAYYKATGKRDVLDLLARYADLINERYGPNEGQERGYPGHPEIEMALVKLYEATGEERYLDLAKFFVDERGQQEPHFFDQEAIRRGEDPDDYWAQTYRYCQSHAPLREQTEPTGHAVRAMYLYAAVTDLAHETGDESLAQVAKTLWQDLVAHQMYLTGGLGPARANEGFTFEYDLPNETGYTETCAAIALVFWAHRMFHLDPDGRYIDVLERSLYNSVLSGISQQGDEYFYSNPLSSYPNVDPHDHFSGITSAEYYRRKEWLLCPCCPPNLARLVSSIGSYFYSTQDDNRIYVHLYNTGTADIPLGEKSVKIDQTANYPWDGDVRLSVSVDAATSFELALRIPGWCRNYSVSLNGEAYDGQPEAGYIVISREWQSGDTIALTLDMPVERIGANPHIREDAGQVALQRGPLVYCLEEVDNGPQLANIVLKADAALEATVDEDLFGGVPVIKGKAVRIEPSTWPGGLYQPQSLVDYKRSEIQLKAIPYYLWANREPGEMRVWIRED